MEMRCDIRIYEYDTNNGKYNSFIAAVWHRDINTSAKELFDETIRNADNIINRFFVMTIESIVEEPFNDSIDFYTVKTNIKGDVDEIKIIGPNSLDADMLIDAIMGCKLTTQFYDKYNDNFIRKIIKSDHLSPEITVLRWASDAKDRLKKLNILRLKEIYENLRANQ